jgi:UDP-N-acetylmuramoyl-L-alanyl-D-glutamate--2,6-diaminopimelate ligase
MTSLKELFLKAGLSPVSNASFPKISVKGIECDSKKIREGFIFVAVQGRKTDGHAFIEEAKQKGACAVVGDRADISCQGLPYFKIEDGRLALARLASAFYDFPSKRFKVAGITGTNGKTSASYLVEHLLLSERKKTGVLGTVNYRFEGEVIPAAETTPGPLKIQEIFARMRDRFCEFAVMEVSSHALDQSRTAGIDFETALFTNLTQDHLDYHKTFQNYFECKAKLFLNLSQEKTAVLNADDAWAMKLPQRIKSRLIFYGTKDGSDLRALNFRHGRSGVSFDLRWAHGILPVELPLLGLYNVYNALGALGVASALGLDLPKAVKNLASFKGVPGRLERLDAGQDFLVFVDFAHTPDGLQNVLSALKPYRKRRLIAVFGCGGDRDRGKRPLMGEIASRLCDFVVVTSDNPRFENPADIAGEVKAGFPAGFKNYRVELDRKKAIRQALLMARKDDVVLLAGKGHETTQVIGSEATPFSDREETLRVLHGR